jgi:hypothetical protein
LRLATRRKPSHRFSGVEMIWAAIGRLCHRFLTKRSFATQRFTKWAQWSLPFLRLVERMSRSRWHTSVDATKRAVGLLALLLAISGMWPSPLINVLPAITIVLLAISLPPGRRVLARLFVRHLHRVAVGIRVPGLDVNRRPRRPS